MNADLMLASAQGEDQLRRAAELAKTQRDILRGVLSAIANDRDYDSTDQQSVLRAFDRVRAVARAAFNAS